MNDDAAMSKKTMEFCWHFSEIKSNKILKKNPQKARRSAKHFFLKLFPAMFQLFEVLSIGHISCAQSAGL